MSENGSGETFFSYIAEKGDVLSKEICLWLLAVSEVSGDARWQLPDSRCHCQSAGRYHYEGDWLFPPSRQSTASRTTPTAFLPASRQSTACRTTPASIMSNDEVGLADFVSRYLVLSLYQWPFILLVHKRNCPLAEL